MKLIDRGAVARRFGMKSTELVDVIKSDHGTIATFADGSELIDVDESTPDADGKTGLMFNIAPDNYKGDFPVFALEHVAAAADSDDSVPTGSVDEVLAWVGEDADRALAVAEAERERSKPRSSLLEALAAVSTHG